MIENEFLKNECKLKADGVNKQTPSAFVVKKRASYKKALSPHHLIVSDSQAFSYLKNAETKVSKGTSKKSKITSLVFMVVNIAVVAGIIAFNITNDSAMSINEVFSLGVNWGFLLLCLVAFGVMCVLESMKFSVLTKSVSGKFQWVTSYKTASYGRYYDSITPLSLGGEPYQVYYLSKHGFSAGQSMSITLGKHVVWIVTYVVFCTAILIARYVGSPILDQYSVGTTVVSAACWIGYAVNAGMMFFITFMSINRRVGQKIVGWVIKLLAKIKIVKNYEKAFSSIMKVVDDFQKGIKYFAKTPAVFISSLVISFASFFMNYTIPFLIFCTFNGYVAGYWFYIMSTCVVVELAASFIPLPGGTGVAELSFSALFASLFLDGRLFWAMLLWRILTYYGYIFQGLGLIVYDYIVGNKKYEWQKRKLLLKKESEEFKKSQLEFYSKRVKPKIK